MTGSTTLFLRFGEEYSAPVMCTCSPSIRSNPQSRTVEYVCSLTSPGRKRGEFVILQPYRYRCTNRGGHAHADVVHALGARCRFQLQNTPLCDTVDIALARHSTSDIFFRTNRNHNAPTRSEIRFGSDAIPTAMAEQRQEVREFDGTDVPLVTVTGAGWL